MLLLDFSLTPSHAHISFLMTRSNFLLRVQREAALQAAMEEKRAASVKGVQSRVTTSSLEMRENVHRSGRSYAKASLDSNTNLVDKGYRRKEKVYCEFFFFLHISYLVWRQDSFLCKCLVTLAHSMPIYIV